MKTLAKISGGTAALTVLALALAGSAFAQESCRKPQSSVNIPDGQSASKDEMIQAQTAVNAFLDEMNTYLECLDERAKVLPEGESGRRARVINDARYTAARDEMQDLAEKFNLQVRVYKLRSERPN
ncbi:MAG: hypothetical protein AAGA68_02690 [Pseudomonadota bacterium]